MVFVKNDDADTYGRRRRGGGETSYQECWATEALPTPEHYSDGFVHGP